MRRSHRAAGGATNPPTTWFCLHPLLTVLYGLSSGAGAGRGGKMMVVSGV